MKKKIRNERSLEIRIYLKSNDKADVVFRKNKVLYRIGVLGALRFLTALGTCLSNLQRAMVLQLDGTRMRKWILEMGLVAEQHAMLQVWEMAENEMKSRFGWAGLPADLKMALSR